MDLYRRTYAQIDLQAIRNNVEAIKRNISAGSGVIAVVKADAYGHGAVPVACTAINAGAVMLAVALAEEAIALREAGITVPVLVIGRSNEAQMKLALALDLELCVFSCGELGLLQKLATQAGKKAVVHLKVDSGMGRIGMRDTDELERLMQVLKESDHIMLSGVFTHFSCADQADKTMTRCQNKRFLEFVEALAKEGFQPKIHAANSAAAIDMPELSYDMIRYGISMYGYYPSDEVGKNVVKLQPAMQVEAEISHIKKVSAKTPVGYGATYLTPAPATVATVQIGYGDGYNRLLSNRGKMIVRTQNGAAYANIIGRICMDQTMIDITGLNGVNVGDAVIVLGRSGDKKITADDIAALCGTISYEVLLDFSGRVPRIYK